jgi:nuclease HARBI1
VGTLLANSATLLTNFTTNRPMEMALSSDEDIDEEIANALNGPALRRPRTFSERRFFDVENPRDFREKFRVSRDVLLYLVDTLGPQLQHATERNRALSAQQQIQVFLHFLGTNSFYHEVKAIHGISSATVCRIVKSVSSAVLTLGPTVIKWPQNLMPVVQKFKDVANFPGVIGAIDGSKITFIPPSEDEDSFVDRHHQHSLNMTIVCGPSHEIFYMSSNCSGRWHDSRVLKNSELWQHFEVEHNLPIPGAVIIGDSAYPTRNWLIPPFKGEVVGPRLRFNKAHSKTRCIVEHTFGIIKHRFYALKTGLRVRKIELASDLIKCAGILHNLCLEMGDDGQDFNDEVVDALGDQAEDAQEDEHQEGRRQEILQMFV